ncbi:Coumaroyl-CoA:anthocyanidin 3-O-glucoside-6''-O-coumaroyltransferase 1 [Spatholobus suberectus]|nr:Coumaroyl-CoA:anthocyanidin 3-O-glucoside-6''-O-coumaroyltransferase 1 [Spatholobus suberectus]
MFGNTLHQKLGSSSVPSAQVHTSQQAFISAFHFRASDTNMAHEMKQEEVKIIERCQVGPPPSSLPSTTLPLTFFDIPWFFCHPIKRIFFYEFPHPTHHFLQTALPILKHSLSLTLQHFFPFAANLIVPPQQHLSYIRYLDGDSLSFAVAESTADFTLLTSDSPQDVRNWHPLVPTLSPPRVEQDGTRVFPLMAIQVTILPNSGFSICLTFNHLAGDGKSLHHFVKFWASLCKTRGDMASLEASLPLPSHERDRVKDPKGLKLIYFQELERRESRSMEFAGLVRDVSTNKVRFTVSLSREQVEKLKKWVSLKCASYTSGTLHISTFVVTCSLIWVCIIGSEESQGGCVAQNGDELCYLVFLADCRDHLEFSLPLTRVRLVGENGIVGVANAIERQIRDLKSDALRNAETLMSDYRELGKPGKSVLVVAGSPKLSVYQTDFGWGKPKKSDAAHIESSGSISLSDCRDEKGGIELWSSYHTFMNPVNEGTTIVIGLQRLKKGIYMIGFTLQWWHEGSPNGVFLFVRLVKLLEDIMDGNSAWMAGLHMETKDIAARFMAFCQQGPQTVYILSATGAICNVTLRQPAMSGGIVSMRKRFENFDPSSVAQFTEKLLTQSDSHHIEVNTSSFCALDLVLQSNWSKNVSKHCSGHFTIPTYQPRPRATHLLLRVSPPHSSLSANNVSHSETLSNTSSPSPPTSSFHHNSTSLNGDSLSFTVAESAVDFTLLTSDSLQDVRNWHPLVPTLSSPCVEQDGTHEFSLMAIQVTVLPNSGFSICLTFNHLASDGKSFHHFVKFWGILCKARGDMASLETSLSLPSHEGQS